MIVSMGSVVRLSHYSDFLADHTDFSVYSRVCKKAKAQKRTINTVNGLHRSVKWIERVLRG